jgi:hypothetical protein
MFFQPGRAGETETTSAATAVPYPAAASLLALRRTELAIAGLALLAGSIAAYLLV